MKNSFFSYFFTAHVLIFSQQVRVRNTPPRKVTERPIAGPFTHTTSGTAAVWAVGLSAGLWAIGGKLGKIHTIIEISNYNHQQQGVGCAFFDPTEESEA